MAQVVNLPRHRTAVVGITGSGKTFWALDWFDHLDAMALYIDKAAVVRRKPWAEKLRPLVVQDPKAIKPMLWHQRKCVYEPRSVYDVDEVIAGLLAWKRKAPDPKPMWIFCDEIHTYSVDWDFPNVQALFTEGRNYGITGVALTQNLPQMRNTSIVSQCQVKVCFSLDDAALASLRRNYSVIPPQEVIDHINTDADRFEDTRQTWNAAVYGIAGTRWVLI